MIADLSRFMPPRLDQAVQYNAVEPRKWASFWFRTVATPLAARHKERFLKDFFRVNSFCERRVDSTLDHLQQATAILLEEPAYGSLILYAHALAVVHATTSLPHL